MKKFKKISIFVVTIFAAQLLLIGANKATVKADTGQTSFYNLTQGTVRNAIQYKDKTLILTMNYNDDLAKMFIDQKGTQNLVQDYSLLMRNMAYAGLINNEAYFVNYYSSGAPIYKVNMDTLKLEQVGKISDFYKRYPYYFEEALIDKSGTKWFSSWNSTWQFTDINGKLLPKEPALVIYNDSGFEHATRLPIRSVINLQDNIGHLVAGSDNDVWVIRSFEKGTDNKVYRVSKEKKFEEYDIDTTYSLKKMVVDKDGKIYIDCVNWQQDPNVKYNSLIRQNETVRKYEVKDGKLQFIQQYDFTDKDLKDIALDASGNVWVYYGYSVSKLANNKFIDKYTVRGNLDELNVYDDYNFVVYKSSVGYTSANAVPTPSTIPDKIATSSYNRQAFDNQNNKDTTNSEMVSVFGKSTIAQAIGTLPQTGDLMNNNDLIIGGFSLLIFGVIFLSKITRIKK